ncbi:hypothetical protein [Demequina sp. NBRC 110053]|uniref:hypothetical protein n=1 Tax=Demequina sp. NBRC 110053 TaxID=1570342 RepID=UPI000A001DCC|nr:hypothetical protein [Demequina sp. NBRC 110053]
MVYAPKFAVYQLDQPDVTLTPTTDEGLARAFFADPQSVAAYWSDVTFGHVDLTTSEVLPRAAYPGPANVVDRTVLLKHVVDGIEAGSGADALDGFHAVFVVINPGVFDHPHPDYDPLDPTTPEFDSRPLRGFAWVLPDGRPVAVMAAEAVVFRTMYHEVGHMLGFEHPFGLFNAAKDDLSTAPVETSTEYGSPYDVMGMRGQEDPSHAPRWWAVRTTFAGTAIAGWGGPLEDQLGPALSRAQLHWRWPEALTHRVTERPLPAGGGQTSVTARAMDRRVVVLRSSTDATNPTMRTYVEYRSATGWDAGFASDVNDSDGEGVVVHVLRHTPSGWRLVYGGAVLRHGADRDVDIWGTGMTLTVDEWIDGGADVRVAVHRNVTQVTLAAVAEMGALGEPIGAIENVPTGCGTYYRRGTWATSTHAVIEARSVGSGGAGEYSGPPPAMVWAVAGRVLSASAGVVLATGGARVTYSLDAFGKVLILDSESGDTLTVDVEAWVEGNPARKGSATLEISGSYTGIHPSDWHIELDCIEQSIPINLEWLRLPTKPIPLEFGAFDWQIERDRATWVDRQRLLLRELRTVHDVDVSPIDGLIDARLQSLSSPFDLTRFRVGGPAGPG